MREHLTGIGDRESTLPVEANDVAVRPDVLAETTLNGASHAGPRVERAEARQQNRDASTAAVTLSVNASDITDYRSFVGFLHQAGFSRAFAKRVTNRDAFKSVAEPSADDQPVTQVIASLFADASAALKGIRK